MTDPYSLRLSALPRPEGGPEGLAWWVTLTLPWFRALPFACLERLDLVVADRLIPERDLVVRREGRLIGLDALRASDRFWGTQESIHVGVPTDTVAPAAGTAVGAEVVIRMPESGSPGTAPRRVASALGKFTTGDSSPWLLGLCSFSLAGELRGGRSLVACLEDVAALGGYGGIELLGPQVAEGYPDLTREELDRLRGRVLDAGLVPLVYGAYTDPGRRTEPASDDDLLAWATVALDAAVALGCDFARINFPAELTIYQRVAELAQDRDIVVLNELHAMTSADPSVASLLDVLAEIDSPHLGLTLDLSSVMSDLPRGFVDSLLRPALPEEAVRMIVDGWRSDQLEADTRAELEALGRDVATRALPLLGRSRRLFRHSDVAWLPDILPHVRVVHGKFFEVVDGADQAVPTDGVFELLRAAAYEGPILAEFEAHLWDENPDTFGELARYRDLVTRAPR